MTSPKILTRSSTDKQIAGVSSGLGTYFDVDPVLFRVGFVVTALMSGAGLLAYLAFWMILPRDDRSATATGAPAAPA